MANLQKFFIDLTDFLQSLTLRFGQSRFSVLTIVLAIIYFALICALTYYFNHALKRYFFHQLKIEKSIRNLLANLISYTTGTFVLIIILQSIGFNLSSLAVIGGALGIGIGLGLQDLTRNLASGLSILIEQKIKIGDFIKFGNYEGYVREISPRTLILRQVDGSSVIMPNSMIIENQVVNYYYETEAVRLSLSVGVAYGTDPVLVTEILLFVAYHQCYVLKEPVAKVLLMDFGDHAVTFELRFWIPKEKMGIYPDILSDLRYMIEYYFEIHQVTIPFPQQDLWLRNPEAIAQSLQDLSLSEETPKFRIRSTDSRLPNPTDSFTSTTLKPTTLKPTTLRQILKRVPYFQDLNDIETRQLLEIGYLENISQGKMLFQENDNGDAFYIIISGKIEVFTESLNKTLAILSTGEFLGELSLMLGTPRTASTRALEDTLLFVINHRNFEHLLQTNLLFRETLMNELARHQEELTQRKQELEARGLVTQEEEDTNVVLWMQKRLKRLFQLS